MSWEEINKSQVVCPCGKGYITQKHYVDDWNRFESGPVVIECEDCKKKYEVESVSHSRRSISDRFQSKYFLLPKDYPEYDGPSETSTYGASANPYSDFTGWLIENFTENELREVETQLHMVKASSRLIGNAAYICKEHKNALKTVRVSSILASVEKAIVAYPDYVGNKQQREEVRKREDKARNIYCKEKVKHQIAIRLD